MIRKIFQIFSKGAGKFARIVSASLLGVLLLLLLKSLGETTESPAPDTLTLYTYDSLVAKGGLGPEIFTLFEKKCRCKVRPMASGDAGQILTRLQLDSERGKVGADLILGIDQQIWERAKPWVEPWGKWIPQGYAEISKEIKVESGFLPFDYGVLAFMADLEILKKKQLSPPESLNDLLKPEWRRNFILEDPRLSTPGLGFVLYAHQVYGEMYFKKLRLQWLTIAPGWDAAYGLFLKGEAPLVWSYTTSQAYHREHGDPARYQAVLFKEGQPLQIEGAALVKGTPHRKLAQDFLEFLISKEAQSRIPKKNWMFPARRNVPLPESFSQLPKSVKWITLPREKKQVEGVLKAWAKTLEGAQ